MCLTFKQAHGSILFEGKRTPIRACQIHAWETFTRGDVGIEDMMLLDCRGYSIDVLLTDFQGPYRTDGEVSEFHWVQGYAHGGKELIVRLLAPVA